MKKYLLGLAAVVFALSLSAFTGDYKKEVKVGTAGLHWFVAPYGAGDYRGNSATIEDRTNQIECEAAGEDECERAFTDLQLSNPLTPNSGVKTEEKPFPAETIYLPE